MKENGESMNFIFLFIKCIIVGFFMLVPGISGGSIAILLNIYDDLLSSLNNIFKSFKSSFTFLFVAGVGGVIGLFLSSFVLINLIKNFYFEMIFLFLGLVIFYSVSLFKNTKSLTIVKKIVIILIGSVIGILLTKIPLGFFDIGNKYLNLFMVGVFLAIALILPGISVSYVLLIFSMYDRVLMAIQELDFLYLFEIGISLMIGVVIVIKILNYFLTTKKLMMEFLIVGFVISSVWIVLPSVNNKKELIYAIIFIFIGLIIRSISTVYKR